MKNRKRFLKGRKKIQEKKYAEIIDLTSNRIEVTNDAEDGYEEKLRKHRFSKIIIVFVAVGIVAAAAVLGYLYFSMKEYHSYEVLSSVERTDTSTAKYEVYGKYVIKYSTDGITCVDKKNNVIWNESYEMRNPIIDICGDYIAVADKEANTVYTFNQSGKQGQIDTLKPVIKVEISGTGVVAVMLEDSSASYIRLYSKEGNDISEIKAVFTDGYPLDIGLSEDGTKIGVSYLIVSSGFVKTKIVFYNFSEVGQNFNENIAGGFEYDTSIAEENIVKEGDKGGSTDITEGSDAASAGNSGTSGTQTAKSNGTIVPEIEFINNNMVWALGDDGFVIYQMKQTPEAVKKVIFDNEIVSTFHNKNYVGFVLQNSGGESRYHVVIYDVNGKKVFSENIDQEFTKIRIMDHQVYFINDMEFSIYSLNGALKYHGTAGSSVLDMYAEGKMNRYILIQSSVTEEIRLK